jgi:hypothetical protein
LKKITDVDDIVVGGFYYCISKLNNKDINILQCFMDENCKYLGSNRIYACKENNQALDKYTIYGPIYIPNFKEIEGSCNTYFYFIRVYLGANYYSITVNLDNKIADHESMFELEKLIIDKLTDKYNLGYYGVGEIEILSISYLGNK